MKSSSVVAVLCALVAPIGLVCGLAGESGKPIELWPNGAPGEKVEIGPERDTTKPTDNLIAGKPLVRLGNVSKPTITVYRPPADKNTGAGVMVAPGGGYHILALDLEGTEVCEWLNSIGVTAVLLKYRVPKRPDIEKHAPALQDAQRAMSLIRYRAKEFGLDPRRLGALGFSAGAHLCAVLSTTTQRSYPVVDEADKSDVRPGFVALIYPAYLTVKELGDKTPLEINVTSNTPPTFITTTEDDPVRMENALHYALALKQVNVPVELHLYPTGGHGYGLRRTQETVTSWPDRASDWLHSRGWLERK
jgi:acetyl esterase/lipase